MLITIDLEHPDNDIELIGLPAGTTIEAHLGPQGYAAYRLLGAAARLLFLTRQRSTKPDIIAATTMMIGRESTTVEQRLRELRQLSRR